MRVLVAGATGAMGTQLVPRLADAGHEVYAMTRSEAGKNKAAQLGASSAWRLCITRHDEHGSSHAPPPSRWQSSPALRASGSDLLDQDFAAFAERRPPVRLQGLPLCVPLRALRDRQRRRRNLGRRRPAHDHRRRSARSRPTRRTSASPELLVLSMADARELGQEKRRWAGS